MPSFTATIMFYIPNYDAAVKFAQAPQHELLIMTGWIILYWVLTYLATKGVKAFSNIAKYGVIIGSLIPLTVIIAMIIPEKQINVLYTLYSVFRILGSTIGMPWLYMVLVWALLFNTIAMVVTNMAGPSFMLGQVGGSGFFFTTLVPTKQ